MHFDHSQLRVVRSLLPDGTVKQTKTEAGVRTIPMLPALARELLALRARLPHDPQPSEYVLATRDGQPLAERNLRRALEEAKGRAKLQVAASQRLSWHSLRHSAGSLLATQLELPITTVARALGHADPSFTYKTYARDASSDDEYVGGVLARAEATGVGA